MNKERNIINSKADGLAIEVLTIKPEGEIKGIVQFSHGMAEHKERYIPFMEYLAKKGYLTIIHDHRGHGKSVKDKEDLGYFYEEKAEYVVEDLHQVTEWMKEQYPDKKLILLGHSMGSMIVRKYTKKYDKDIDGLIVCGSPSKNPLAGLAILIVKVLEKFKGEKYRSHFVQKLAFGSYNKKIENHQSENAWVCKNEEVVTAYENDELCGFIFTLNGFLNLFTLMKDIYSKKGWHVTKQELPIFFIAGSDDPVIVNKEKWLESQEFLKGIGYHNISYQLYPGMRHEILNEGDEIIWEDVVSWIEKNR